MFERVLRRMRGFIRTSRYVMTVHGAEEMAADGLIGPLDSLVIITVYLE